MLVPEQVKQVELQPTHDPAVRNRFELQLKQFEDKGPSHVKQLWSQLIQIF